MKFIVHRSSFIARFKEERMLFPIGDDNDQRRALPVVTWSLIALNVLVYVLFQGLTGENAFTYAYSVVPYEITHNVDLVGDFRVGNGLVKLFPGPTPIWLTILSAMFMHGGLSHIGGNMLYNMGRWRFLIFYLLCGILASAAHILVGPNSRIPSLGASGAIAGVLGAYLIMFPQNSVRVIAFYQIIPMPAIIVIGLWGLLQFWNGFGSLAGGGASGGVAYMAHVGGFVAGIVLCFFFRDRSLSLPEQRQAYRTQFYRERDY
jgi:membrane associated rhomboid family serine protease